MSTKNTENVENTEVSEKNADDEVSRAAAHGIAEQREIIDSVDEQIIRLLAQRFQATQRVGEFKAQAGFAAFDSALEERQQERTAEIAKNVGLEEEIAHSYLDFVVTESKKRHKKIAERKQ